MFSLQRSPQGDMSDLSTCAVGNTNVAHTLFCPPSFLSSLPLTPQRAGSRETIHPIQSRQIPDIYFLTVTPITNCLGSKQPHKPEKQLQQSLLDLGCLSLGEAGGCHGRGVRVWWSIPRAGSHPTVLSGLFSSKSSQHTPLWALLYCPSH